MYEQIKKQKKNKNKASLNSTVQKTNKKLQKTDFTDNRSEIKKHRKLQSMADNYSDNKQKSIQMVYDREIEADRMNVIGEYHKKSKERRWFEKALAKSRRLKYMTEGEFGYIKNEKIKMGDPCNLRILYAITDLYEIIKEIERKKLISEMYVENEYNESIDWLINNVRGDILKYAQDSENENIIELYDNLDKHLTNKDYENSKFAIIDIIQIISPGKLMGFKRDLSYARSEAMHKAATKCNNHKVMWMVGEDHAKEIDKDFPEREYVLLGEEEMDNELKKYITDIIWIF